ncbi:MAG: HAD hydrolase-like protein [Clostridia bacterium]|nr:HAD hydrolase-like protein [Clostridia bacterium]
MRILFDFDGTVADTSEGILSCLRYTLESLSVPIPSTETLKGFIGPSMFNSFRLITGLSDEVVDEAVRKYREYYKREGVYKLKLYEGMETLLKSLREKGHTLCVASLKPKVQLDTAVNALGVYEYFDIVAGASESKKDNDKREILSQASNGEKSVMIGDSPYDIIAGNALGFTTIAVTYGFTTEEKLREQKPCFIASTVAEIEQIIDKITE